MGIDTCSHNCQNTLGSYTCSCGTGYELNIDRNTCSGMHMHYFIDVIFNNDHYIPSQMSMNVRKELLHVSITATTRSAVIHAAVHLFTRSAAMDTTVMLPLVLPPLLEVWEDYF